MQQPVLADTEGRVRRGLARAGSTAAIAAAVLTVIWLVTLVAAPLPQSGSTADHLLALRDDDVRTSLPYLVVLPFGLLLLPVWIALAARAWRDHPVAAALTPAFGLLYAPFTLLAYWSQLTVARGIADAYGRDPVVSVAAYQLFDFGTETSLTFALDIGGYAILGLGSVCAAVLLWSDGRLGRLAGALLALSGALSIIGAAGLALRASALQVGAIASGPPFLIAIVGIAVLLRRDQAQAG